MKGPYVLANSFNLQWGRLPESRCKFPIRGNFDGPRGRFKVFTLVPELFRPIFSNVKTKRIKLRKIARKEVTNSMLRTIEYCWYIQDLITILCVFSQFVGNIDSNTSEVLAIKRAVELIHYKSTLHSQDIVIVSDSKSTVSWVNNGVFGNLNHVDMIYDIQNNMNTFLQLIVAYDSRAFNAFADSLESKGLEWKPSLPEVHVPTRHRSRATAAAGVWSSPPTLSDSDRPAVPFLFITDVQFCLDQRRSVFKRDDLRRSSLPLIFGKWTLTSSPERFVGGCFI
ncbi:hypothetical protein LWI28_019244 [Acer negundo]|uniref:RNase H type-1 domain-containing protein n=1 Tax=Acer negundo TaxID=4023 RepID=A0AAD5NXT7_ACENE|nr:hypothetical protein LWI28_019244 [Acer negundo]